MVKVKHLAWILTAILEERVESPQKRGPLSEYGTLRST